ncbi:hypothetical protein EON67_04860 [archaeon]|nr:MAG: hypothetical protein EON67_04860 [archaeon]
MCVCLLACPYLPCAPPNSCQRSLERLTRTATLRAVLTEPVYLKMNVPQHDIMSTHARGCVVRVVS